MVVNAGEIFSLMKKFFDATGMCFPKRMLKRRRIQCVRNADDLKKRVTTSLIIRIKMQINDSISKMQNEDL